MKKTFCIFLLIATCFQSISQEKEGATTITEFNYLTKGYKIQLESGLDMKKGYSLRNFYTSKLKGTDGVTRELKLKFLMRDNQKIPCATLVVFDNDKNKNPFYYCVPGIYSSNDMWQKSYDLWMDASTIYSEGAKSQIWNFFRMTSKFSYNVQK